VCSFSISINDAALYSWVNESENIHSYYLKWKQVYKNYKASDETVMEIKSAVTVVSR
jgi:hypothetical protein